MSQVAPVYGTLSSPCPGPGPGPVTARTVSSSIRITIIVLLVLDPSGKKQSLLVSKIILHRNTALSFYCHGRGNSSATHHLKAYIV